MGFFLETLIGGLMTGMLYSLVALGFVLIFKASGVFNFAQGAMVLFAALAMARFSEWFPALLNFDNKLLANLMAFCAAVLCMVGVMLPSSVLTWQATRWGHRNRNRRSVRAFKQGMAPVVIGLLLATAWVLTRTQGSSLHNWPLWALTAIAALLVWRTKLHLLWMLGAGALLGAMGWV